MGTESEMRIARYRQTETEQDDLGRIIGVRRLRPSEQGRLQGMTNDLSGSEEIIDPITGDKSSFDRRMPYFIAAAVCKINESHIPFPRNRGELDAIYDRLDLEGIKAASIALGRLMGTSSYGNEGGDPLEEAKN